MNLKGKTEEELEALKTERVQAQQAIDGDIDEIAAALRELVTERKASAEVERFNNLSPEVQEAIIQGASASLQSGARGRNN